MCWAICMASSLVGTITRAVLVWSTCGSVIILLISGNKNAAVLPVPVWAEAMISFPCKTNGITCSCTGVAFSYPDASIPSIKRSSKPNSVNFKVKFYFGEDNAFWVGRFRM